MKQYLSYGGGVNSKALLLFLHDKGVEFEAVMVHHGTDWPETYHDVAATQWWLKSQGLPPITILIPEVVGYQRLIDYCEGRAVHPHASKRWCTADWKVRVLHKYFVRPCFELIGIDAGESHRAKISSVNDVESRWPLIEAGINREGCKKIIRDHDLPVPLKSGCYVCPFQKISQWRRLRREHPDLFCKARGLEEAATKRRGVGRSTINSRGIPLERLVREGQGMLFDEMEYPPCHCGL